MYNFNYIHLLVSILKKIKLLIFIEKYTMKKY